MWVTYISDLHKEPHSPVSSTGLVPDGTPKEPEKPYTQPTEGREMRSPPHGPPYQPREPTPPGVQTERDRENHRQEALLCARPSAKA